MPPKAVGAGRTPASRSVFGITVENPIPPSGGDDKQTPAERLQEASGPLVPSSGDDDSYVVPPSKGGAPALIPSSGDDASSGPHAAAPGPLVHVQSEQGPNFSLFTADPVVDLQNQNPQNTSGQSDHSSVDLNDRQPHHDFAPATPAARTNIAFAQAAARANADLADLDAFEVQPASRASQVNILAAARQQLLPAPRGSITGPLHPWPAARNEMAPSSRFTVPAAPPKLKSHPLAAVLPPNSKPPPQRPWTNVKPELALEELERHLYAAGHFTEEERSLIRRADQIGPEKLSQDTDPGAPKTKHGYTKDGFVDDTDSDFHSADSSSENDTESCAIGSDADSDEDKLEREYRLDIVKKLFKKAPELSVSSTEIEPITIKRRTGRTRYLEILLNHWIRIPPTLNVEDLDLFLKLVKLLPQECRNEVYSVLARGVQRRSQELYKFVFKCVRTYIPEQGLFFNAIHVKNKNKLNVGKSKAPALAEGDKKSSHLKRAKPTVVKPTLKSIENIHDVTFHFLNEYNRYAHDHATNGYEHDSLFGCLTADQQATMCDMTKHTIASVEQLDLESQLDLFRGLFGHKSSAAVIDDLSTLEFVGDPLSPAAWAVFKTRFQKVLNLTQRDARPPEQELARRFVYACPLKMLKNDVQARKPQSLAGAMDCILGRLNDHGFLRSLATRSLAARGPPQREQRAADFRLQRDPRDHRHDNRDRPRLPINRDVIIAPPSSAPAHNHTPGQAQARARHVAAGNAAAGNMTRFKAHPPCERCKRTDGHKKDACISKHDVDGKRLEPLEPAVYAKNKERYFILKDQLKAAIDNESDESSQTSDELDASPRNYENDYEDDDVDCVCLVHSDEDPLWFPVDSVPAPRLVDVELNPGPLSKKDIRKLAKQKNRDAIRFVNFEMVALFAFHKVVFATTADRQNIQEPLFSPAVVLSMVLTVVIALIFAARRKPLDHDDATPFAISNPAFAVVTSFVFVATTAYSILLFESDPSYASFWAAHATLCFVLAARLVGIEPNPGPDTENISVYGILATMLLVAIIFTAIGAEIISIDRKRIQKVTSHSDRFDIDGNTSTLPARCSAADIEPRCKAPPCDRCGKQTDGHSINSCISKHHVNGHRLAMLDRATFEQRKERYYALRLGQSEKNFSKQAAQARNVQNAPRAAAVPNPTYSNVHIMPDLISDCDSDSDNNMPPSALLVGIEPNPGPPSSSSSEQSSDSLSTSDTQERTALIQAISEMEWISRNQTIFPIHPPPYPDTDSSFQDDPYSVSVPHWGMSFPGNAFWNHMFLQSLPALLRGAYNFYPDDVIVIGRTIHERDRNVSNLQRFYRQFLIHCARFIPPPVWTPAPSLLMDGDVESNPGPKPVVQLIPSDRRPPYRQIATPLLPSAIKREFKTEEDRINDIFGPLVIPPTVPAQITCELVQVSSVSPTGLPDYDLSALLLGQDTVLDATTTDSSTASDTAIYNAVIPDN